ncbi:hypothetical protein C8Q76DRAFT_122868 [Earliella scabrosa]|nr:hypothetical protein C8Q76DRAFT_122868 [Earliella scabrosa]
MRGLCMLCLLLNTAHETRDTSPGTPQKGRWVQKLRAGRSRGSSAAQRPSEPSATSRTRRKQEGPTPTRQSAPQRTTAPNLYRYQLKTAHPSWSYVPGKHVQSGHRLRPGIMHHDLWRACTDLPQVGQTGVAMVSSARGTVCTPTRGVTAPACRGTGGVSSRRRIRTTKRCGRASSDKDPQRPLQPPRCVSGRASRICK